ncbi:DUF58 domain-containing protein [bacterium]|nr:DUF58 domain-containing protein [bacterium]
MKVKVDKTKQKSDIFKMLLIIFFLFLAATNTQAGWLFVIIAISLSTLIISIIHPYIRVKKISVKRQLTSFAVQAKTRFQVEIQVTNNSGNDIPLVSVTDNWESDLLKLVAPIPESGDQDKMFILHDQEKRSDVENDPQLKDKLLERSVRFFIPNLPARETINLVYNLKCERRGIYKFKDISVGVRHYLSFWESKKDLPQQLDTLSVYPAVILMDKRKSGLEAEKAKRFIVRDWENSGDIRGLHNYTVGEDVRRIHWPASARTGNLMIKEFQNPSEINLQIILFNKSSLAKILAPILQANISLYRNDSNSDKKKSFEFTVFGFEEILCTISSVISPVNYPHINVNMLYMDEKNGATNVSGVKAIQQLLPTLHTVDTSPEIEEKFWQTVDQQQNKNRSTHTLILSMTPELPCQYLRKLKNASCIFWSPNTLKMPKDVPPYYSTSFIPLVRALNNYQTQCLETMNLIKDMRIRSFLVTPKSTIIDEQNSNFLHISPQEVVSIWL